MSLNDVEGVRETFTGFNIDAVKTTYTIGIQNDARSERGEVLISNYKLSSSG